MQNEKKNTLNDFHYSSSSTEFKLQELVEKDTQHLEPDINPFIKHKNDLLFLDFFYSAKKYETSYVLAFKKEVDLDLIFSKYLSPNLTFPIIFYEGLTKTVHEDIKIGTSLLNQVSLFGITLLFKEFYARADPFFQHVIITDTHIRFTNIEPKRFQEDGFNELIDWEKVNTINCYQLLFTQNESMLDSFRKNFEEELGLDRIFTITHNSLKYNPRNIRLEFLEGRIRIIKDSVRLLYNNGLYDHNLNLCIDDEDFHVVVYAMNKWINWLKLSKDQLKEVQVFDRLNKLRRFYPNFLPRDCQSCRQVVVLPFHKYERYLEEIDRIGGIYKKMERGYPLKLGNHMVFSVNPKSPFISLTVNGNLCCFDKDNFGRLSLLKLCERYEIDNKIEHTNLSKKYKKLKWGDRYYKFTNINVVPRQQPVDETLENYNMVSTMREFMNDYFPKRLVDSRMETGIKCVPFKVKSLESKQYTNMHLFNEIPGCENLVRVGPTLPLDFVRLIKDQIVWGITNMIFLNSDRVISIPFLNGSFDFSKSFFLYYINGNGGEMLMDSICRNSKRAGKLIKEERELRYNFTMEKDKDLILRFIDESASSKISFRLPSLFHEFDHFYYDPNDNFISYAEKNGYLYPVFDFILRPLNISEMSCKRFIVWTNNIKLNSTFEKQSEIGKELWVESDGLIRAIWIPRLNKRGGFPIPLSKFVPITPELEEKHGLLVKSIRPWELFDIDKGIYSIVCDNK